MQGASPVADREGKKHLRVPRQYPIRSLSTAIRVFPSPRSPETPRLVGSIDNSLSLHTRKGREGKGKSKEKKKKVTKKKKRSRKKERSGTTRGQKRGEEEKRKRINA